MQDKPGDGLDNAVPAVTAGAPALAPHGGIGPLPNGSGAGRPMRHVVPRALVNRITDWLMEQALADTDLQTIVEGCCERILAAGIPIARAFFGFSVLHPLHSAKSFTWRRGQPMATDDYPHSPEGLTENFRKSPFHYLMTHQLDVLRVPLDCPVRQFDFPIVADLRREGITDYLAFRIAFDRTELRGLTGSWASDHGGGFSEDDIDALMRIQQRLAVATKVALKTELMRNVVDTYLGSGPGRFVLDGQIRRGDGQSIQAAIWFADIRGSTTMADRLSQQAYIDTINSFFDATGSAVADAGGEVLSFVGDGLLAIFPTIGPGRTVEGAAAAALEAALDARARLAALNSRRSAADDPPIGYGISLNEGEVLYGNVGVPARLSFSAFGAAVNEVTRIDQLTKSLREPILVSEALARHVDHPWRPMGKFKLRGVERRIRILAPRLATLEDVA
ncbi:MAG: adenylate/guanylate cyclase domain-containing protein [Hyphomicrobiaceae bacterium]